MVGDIGYGQRTPELFVPIAVHLVGDSAAAASELYQRQHRVRAVGEQLRFGPLGQGVGGIEVTTFAGQACFGKFRRSRPHRLSGVSSEPSALIGGLVPKRFFSQMKRRPSLEDKRVGKQSGAAARPQTLDSGGQQGQSRVKLPDRHGRTAEVKKFLGIELVWTDAGDGGRYAGGLAHRVGERKDG